MPNVKPISIDGSTLEGGGQLTRVALCLAAITNTPIHIYRIRANRGPGARRTDSAPNWKKSQQSNRHDSKDKYGKISGPKDWSSKSQQPKGGKVEGGLKESHLAALQWLADQCDAYVEDAEVGSREVTFLPGLSTSNSKTHTSRIANSRSDLVDLDTNTITLQNPGSVWLIFQALYPFMVFGFHHRKIALEPSTTTPVSTMTVTFRGGTNVSKSMSVDFVTQIFLPICHRIGLPETQVKLIRRGWASGAPQIGEVQVSVKQPLLSSHYFHLPAFFTPECGDITSIDITVVANPESTRHHLINLLTKYIAEEFGPDMSVNVTLDEDSEDPRHLYVLLVAQTSGGWPVGRDFLGTGRTPKSTAELARIIETAARTVTRDLGREINRGGVVDEFMQDQLVVFQALAEGRSMVDGGKWKDEEKGVVDEDEQCGDEKGSLHTRTVRWVCKQILDGRRGEKKVEFRPGGECVGVGWNSQAGNEVIKQ